MAINRYSTLIILLGLLAYVLDVAESSVALSTPTFSPGAVIREYTLVKQLYPHQTKRTEKLISFDNHDSLGINKQKNALRFKQQILQTLVPQKGEKIMDIEGFDRGTAESKLAQGFYGEAWIVEKGGKTFVMKFILNEHAGNKEVQELTKKEIAFYKKAKNCLHVAHMVDSFEYQREGKSGGNVIVMEHYNEGDFFGFYDRLYDEWELHRGREQPLGIDVAQLSLKILKNAENGLKCLHNLNIVHSDVSYGNIFVHRTTQSDGTVIWNGYVGDLGLAKSVGYQRPVSDLYIQATREFASPEVFLREPYTAKSDIYSLTSVIADCAGTLSVQEIPVEKAGFSGRKTKTLRRCSTIDKYGFWGNFHGLIPRKQKDEDEDYNKFGMTYIKEHDYIYVLLSKLGDKKFCDRLANNFSKDPSKREYLWDEDVLYRTSTDNEAKSDTGNITVGHPTSPVPPAAVNLETDQRLTPQDSEEDARYRSPRPDVSSVEVEGKQNLPPVPPAVAGVEMIQG